LGEKKPKQHSPSYTVSPAFVSMHGFLFLQKLPEKNTHWEILFSSISFSSI